MIESAISVALPSSLQHVDPEQLERARLLYATHQFVEMADAPRRWPCERWLTGAVDDLADAIDP